MRKPHAASNIPIILTRKQNCIEISGRLYKNNGLLHDPNIGALSIIAACLRKLGWKEQIIITKHGLAQKHIGQQNKFIRIANQLNIELDGLLIPKTTLPKQYWHYEQNSEKLATIFIHIVVESFTNCYSIFDNHAGCEKSYFKKPNGDLIPLAKYSDRESYKAGNKDKIIYIPDLVLIDTNEKQTITIEGKKYKFRKNGIKELTNYTTFDEKYLSKYYPKYKIIRTVVLYGGKETEIIEVEIGFLLNDDGRLILGIKAPKVFTESINRLLSYWN